MKKVLTLLMVLSATLATPAFAQKKALLVVSDREVAMPALNSELETSARQYSAHLADLLRLSTAQVRHLQGPTYEVLQQLRWAAETDPAHAEAGEAQAVAQYLRRLTKVLSPNQYSSLLTLEDYRPTALASATLLSHL